MLFTSKQDNAYTQHCLPEKQSLTLQKLFKTSISSFRKIKSKVTTEYAFNNTPHDRGLWHV